MRLSRGWYALIFFWVGFAALGGIGAAILQTIGPPAPIDDSAQDERVRMALSDAAQDAAVETPNDVDETSSQLAREAPPESRETTISMDPDEAPFDAWTVVPYLRMPVAIDGGNETGAGTRQAAARPETTRLLRITRDHKLCPKIVCYKWHLVTQRAKLPRGARIDLAQLRLAPSLREATENGKVDLIINATEHHEAASGRRNVIFVATSLFGVTPHDEAP